MSAVRLGLSAVLLMPLFAASAAPPQKAVSLLSFDTQTGFAPWSGVTADRHGNLFGTNTAGGTGPCGGGFGCGTVYELSPPESPKGTWPETTLYSFQGGADGSFPSSPLTLGPSGEIYGTNEGGNYGAIYSLTPPGSAGQNWTFTDLYVVNGTSQGQLDLSTPVIYARGALYGVAGGGGTGCGGNGCGLFYRLAPNGAGGWSYTALFNFAGDVEGGIPTSIAGPDAAGGFYISTSYRHGTIVRFAPEAGGGFGATLIANYQQTGTTQSGPADLVLAPDGTLYATLVRPGGAVMSYVAADNYASWTATQIATVVFHDYAPDSLALGNAGTLIGTVEGDFDFFPGEAFELTPPASGTQWIVTGLWNFGQGPDRNPLNMVVGWHKQYYGVLSGGDSDNGSVFGLN